jgi:hypothetical protein
MMDGSMLKKSRVELETGVAQLIDQLQSDSKNG